MSCLVHRADVVAGRGCQQVGREGICSLEVLEEEEERSEGSRQEVQHTEGGEGEKHHTEGC